MGFRDNLLKKIEITRLADKVVRSINPADSTQRIDRDAMRQLLGVGDYAYMKERDLDIYRIGDGHLLLLDNELKIYNTTIEDVALRKSPTVKEMLSIRNAIKILNDKDVVISRKADTVRHVQTELVDSLDLSYTPGDIASLAEDGLQALKNKYAEGVIEIMTLFAELLEFREAPKAFQALHHRIWGRVARSDKGESLFGPAVIFSMMHNSLKMHPHVVNSADKAAIQRYGQIVKGDIEADLADTQVVERLKQMVLEKAPPAAIPA
jgi:hypothetical protein